ncbi:hypothetical protein [Kineococcus sp. SYSU DK005]|uniref:hypothetical protein n=1 Tax=Kineococcus sp. SYSU DK005 TaxID=3383126 RepID=UPI003D7EBA41
MTTDGRRRAERVRAGLVELWGEELPPGDDPVVAVLDDALTLDDDHGRADGFVVRGDALALPVLRAVLAAEGGLRERLALLPEELRQRLGP